MGEKTPDEFNKISEREALADFFLRDSRRIREKIKNGNIILSPLSKSNTERVMGGTVQPGTVYHHTLPKHTDSYMLDRKAGSVPVSAFLKKQPQEIHFRAIGSAAVVKLTCFGNFVDSKF